MDPRPAIVIVDDEPQELASLLDALIRRFGGDYRIVPHLSASAALAEMGRLRADGGRIALVIADQRTREMPGVDLLARVRELDPNARRALLVAWGDPESSATILQGCAFGKLENYVTKPWAPAEVHLYPVISEFLAEWTQTNRPEMELVRVIGDRPSPRTHALVDRLARSGVPHGFYAAGTPEAAKLAAETGDRPRAPAGADPARRPRPRGSLARRGVGGPRRVERRRGQLRPRDRRGRSRRARRRRVRGLGGAPHAGRGARGRGGPGRDELAHPQLPRVPARHQRGGAREASVRTGVALRRQVRARPGGRGPVRSRRRAGGEALGRARDHLPRRPDRHRDGLQAPGSARPVRGRRGVLHRHPGPAGDARPRRVRGGERELRRSGGGPPRAERTKGDAPRPRRGPRDEDVRLPRPGDPADAQRGGAAAHRGGRGRGRGPARAAHAPRPGPRRARDRPGGVAVRPGGLGAAHRLALGDRRAGRAGLRGHGRRPRRHRAPRLAPLAPSDALRDEHARGVRRGGRALRIGQARRLRRRGGGRGGAGDRGVPRPRSARGAGGVPGAARRRARPSRSGPAVHAITKHRRETEEYWNGVGPPRQRRRLPV